MLLIHNNGKIHLKSANSQYPLTRKHSIIMITKMPGIEHFSITWTFTHGFSISMTLVKIHFLSGSTVGGFCLDVFQQFFPQKHIMEPLLPAYHYNGTIYERSAIF